MYKSSQNMEKPFNAMEKLLAPLKNRAQAQRWEGLNSTRSVKKVKQFQDKYRR